MTVDAGAVNRVSEVGDGAETEFSFGFRIFAAADLVVNKVVTATNVQTLQVLTTDYAVTINGIDNALTTPGGTVTYVTAPLATETSLIVAQINRSQETDFPVAGNIPEVAIEDGLDKLTLQNIDQDELLDRSAKFPEAFPSSVFDPELPIPVADSTIVINATNDGFDIGPTTTEIEDAEANATAAAASAAAASASETAAAASATSAADSVDTIVFRDTVFVDDTDSPVAIAASDKGKFWIADTTNGNIEFDLPAVSTLDLSDPWTIAIKKSAGANQVTLDPNGTDTVDGASSLALDDDQEGVILVPDTDPSPDGWESMNFGTTVATPSAGNGAWTHVVGSAAEVSAGTADFSSIASAISAASAGDSMLILQSYTGTENITIDKQLLIEGMGRGSVITGTVTFDGSSDYSCLNMIKVTGLITLQDGAEGVIVDKVWSSQSTQSAAVSVDPGATGAFVGVIILE